MKRAVVLVALTAASFASAQEWRFELSNPVLSPATPSTFVTLSIDHSARDYAFAEADLSVSATEAGWSDPVALLALGDPPFGGHPLQNPGSISGSDVTEISVRQFGVFGWTARPGRIDVWRGSFTVTDFSAGRAVDLRTETTRFEVYADPPPADPLTAPRTPTEGRGQIVVVPAPASLALLVAGALFAGRRRLEESPCRRNSR